MPSIKPTLIAPNGPLKGNPDMATAADAAKKDKISGSTSLSEEITVQITCTSYRKSSLKRGLNGLSINLEVSVSFSVGLPSLLKKPPGIFPVA